MSKYLDGIVGQIRAYEEVKMTAPEVLIKLTRHIEGRLKTNLVAFGDTLNKEYQHKAHEDTEILEYLQLLKEGKADGM